MKSIFSIFVFTFFVSSASAQKWSGQWSGSFDSKGEPGSQTEYVLEIEAKGNTFTGTSITYFTSFDGVKRYYTICEIKGTIDLGSKTLVSTETKVIKKNTPPEQGDCLQIHTLTYFRKGEDEQLVGTWKPANPNQPCGTGATTLGRKQLVKNKVTAPAPPNNTVRMNTVIPKPKTPATKPPVKNNNQPTTAKQQPVTKPPLKKDSVAKTKPSITKVEAEVKTQANPNTKPVIAAPKLPNGLERRDNKVFETITIDQEEITVTLFDNAEIDGDIITVLFNGEVVAQQKSLTDKPITLKLKAIKARDNTLTMYAENQGKIPPNTAIMRVQSGDNYYKVFLSADDKKNASVVFRVK
jgi:hypothetical protein